MKRYRAILVCLAIAFLFAFGYWKMSKDFERAEAQFECRPTSYWRSVVIDWLEIKVHVCRPLSLWDRTKLRLGLNSESDQLKLLDNIVKLANNAAADAVLSELSSDNNPNVARFANELATNAIRDGRGREERNRELLIRLLWKYNLLH